MTATSTEKREYFLSYSRTDEEHALRLANDLIAAGVSVWVDQYDIRASQHWDSEIEAAVRRCGGMLVILSPRSTQSANVADEVACALDAGKCVIPFLIEKCAMPLRMTRLQLIDATTDYDRALRKCLDEIMRASCTWQPGSTAGTLASAPNPAPSPAMTSVAAGTTLSSHESALLCEELARFLGPIAPHIIRREAINAPSMDQLRARLAQLIPTEAERKEFLG
jgi:hypothetical protein